jgi:hypothetical protein
MKFLTLFAIAPLIVFAHNDTPLTSQRSVSPCDSEIKSFFRDLDNLLPKESKTEEKEITFTDVKDAIENFDSKSSLSKLIAPKNSKVFNFIKDFADSELQKTAPKEVYLRRATYFLLENDNNSGNPKDLETTATILSQATKKIKSDKMEGYYKSIPENIRNNANLANLAKQVNEKAKQNNACYIPEQREFGRELKKMLSRADNESNKELYFDKLINLVKDRPLLGCGDSGIESFFETIRNYVMNQKDSENYFKINKNNGKNEVEAALKNKDFSLLAKLSRNYFHSEPGQKALLLNTIHLLKDNQPLLAASYIESAVKYVNPELKKQFQLLGLIAFKQIGDEKNYKECEKAISSENEIAFGPKSIFPKPRIKDLNKCVKQKTQEDILAAYIKDETTVLDALTNNPTYLHNFFKEKDYSKKIDTQVPWHLEKKWFNITADDTRSAVIDLCNSPYEKYFAWFGSETIEHYKEFSKNYKMSEETAVAHLITALGWEKDKGVGPLIFLLENKTGNSSQMEAILLALAATESPESFPTLLRNASTIPDTLAKTVIKNSKKWQPFLIQQVETRTIESADAIFYLSKIPKPEKVVLDTYAKALLDNDHVIVTATLAALQKGDYKIEGDLLKNIQRHLNSKEVFIRFNALKTLASRTPEDPKIQKAVYQKLGDLPKEDKVDLLSCLGPHGKEKVLELFNSKNLEDKFLSYPLLSKALGKKEARTLLIKELDTPTTGTVLALGALSKTYGIFDSKKELVAIYEKILKDGDLFTKLAVLDEIKKMGPAAKPLVSKLVSFLNKDDSLAGKSSSALRSLGGVAAPEVAKALSDPARSIEARAILYVMGESALSAKKELVEVLKNKNVEKSARAAAINILSLSVLKRDDPSVLKAMVEMANDSDHELRSQARHRILYPILNAKDLDEVFSKTSKFTIANKIELLLIIENHPSRDEVKKIFLKVLSDPDPQIVHYLSSNNVMFIMGTEGITEIERLIKKENRQDLIPLLQRFRQ